MLYLSLLTDLFWLGHCLLFDMWAGCGLSIEPTHAPIKYAPFYPSFTSIEQKAWGNPAKEKKSTKAKRPRVLAF